MKAAGVPRRPALAEKARSAAATASAAEGLGEAGIWREGGARSGSMAAGWTREADFKDWVRKTRALRPAFLGEVKG